MGPRQCAMRRVERDRKIICPVGTNKNWTSCLRLTAMHSLTVSLPRVLRRSCGDVSTRGGSRLYLWTVRARICHGSARFMLRDNGRHLVIRPMNSVYTVSYIDVLDAIRTRSRHSSKGSHCEAFPSQRHSVDVCCFRQRDRGWRVWVSLLYCENGMRDRKAAPQRDPRSGGRRYVEEYGHALNLDDAQVGLIELDPG